MGMSTYVKGCISIDSDEYKKHLNVFEACLAAGVKELPKETADFFGFKEVEPEFLREKLEIDIPYKDNQENMEHSFEVLVKDIPKNVYKIKFINSY